MPEGKGYKKQNIAQISEAIEMLQEAIMSLEDGDIKDQLMEAVMPIQETVTGLEVAPEASAEDQMLGLEEEGDGSLSMGEPKPFQPEKAQKENKSPFGAKVEDEE